MIIKLSYRNLFRIIIGLIIGTYILLITLLNIPFIQKRLSSVVADELSEKLNTEVRVGNIDIGLLNRIIIRDLQIKDLNNSDLLNISDLSAKFQIAPLFEGKIVISSVQIFNFYLNLNRTDIDKPINIQFIIDALASKDKNKKESKVDLRINSLLIQNGNFKYDVLSQPETPNKFNKSHIEISNLSGIVSLKALTADSLNARVRRLQFKEKSGIDLERFSFRVTANNNKLAVSNIDIKLPSSSLKFNNIVFRYDSLKTFTSFNNKVKYSGNLIAHINPKDLSPFIPVFNNYNENINLNLRLSGDNNTIVCSRLNVSDDLGMDINAEALITGLKKEETSELSLSIFNSNLSNRNINNIINCLGVALPAPITERKFINFKGEISGILTALALNGTLQSDLGIVNTKVVMNRDSIGIRSYSGKVNCQKFSLTTLFKNEDFGDVDFDIQLKGFNYKNKYPESYIVGKVKSLDYKGYKYSNIDVDGIFKNGGFNGKLNIADKNCNVDVKGIFNIEQKRPIFNVVAKVKDFSPNKLNLSKDYKDSYLSFNLNANFVGKSIDDIDGTISIDSIALNAPDNGSFFVENISVKANHNGKSKEIIFNSPFMNGSILGEFNYESLPISITSALNKYIPSLVAEIKSETPHNNFDFNFNIDNSEFFSKMLFIPIELNKPAQIKGFVNDDENRLKIEASLPEFKYKNSQYDSGILNIENNGKELLCNLYGSSLLNSGVMVNLSVKSSLKNNELTTTLNWGNNAVNTYGGKFSTVTSFYKSEESDKIGADIRIEPTKVILNDSIWNIRPSHVSINNGNIDIDHFIFDHDNQHIIIDGKLSNNPQDSCNIDLKDIDIRYILDIVSFDDVLFGGMMTGDVVLKNLMNSPEMYANLDVNSFSVNDAILGRADIKGLWDNENSDIIIDAKMKDGKKYTNVTGFVSPKRSELDLYIDAGGTNIALLTPFVDGIFSDIRGSVYGDIRLFGDFKRLDFEGKAMADLEMKVDELNTYYRIINDSIHISPGEFALKNVHFFDRENNSGYVTGALTHTKLKNLMYHFNINGNNLLMYNTTQSSPLPFYGKVYGTGNIILDGGNNAMNIDASIRTSNNTTFTYLTTMPNEAKNTQFITFVDKTPKRIHEEVETNLYHHLNKVEKKEESGPPMDLHINMAIEATPAATMNIVMDPISGDNISATGNGNLQVNYYNKGDFRIFGNYNINKGMYKLSMQEIIRKDFTLKQGGTVTFSGDPSLANLDVQASYTVNSASLSDLGVGITTSQGGQSTVKVNCLMNLTGSISDPLIKFDLELPTLNEEDKEIVRSVTRTEEQMNTQIIYLLGIGKFYTYDYANNANSQSSNATSSLAFSTLSGQLNNMLSQWVDNKNWNIGANLSTGEKGWTDVEAEAILSGSLLNNRLLINGNFGYKDNAMANTNFIGDFEAIWLLTKDGDWRLRGYNQTNDRYYLKSTLTTQGIGIMYKKEFSKWNDLFKWALWWKKDDKK